MTVLSVVGARPQFIKAALVSRRIRNKGIREIMVHTGQHYDSTMSDVFFEELNLPKPDYHLGVGSGPHGEQTGKMLMELEKVLLHEKPGAVLVYGDTNTTLAGALAAGKLHIRLAHIEAGLRSYNKRMPEEINRVLTDHCSDILFCPNEIAAANLQEEGFSNIANGGKIVDDDHIWGPNASDFAVEISPRRLLRQPLVVNVGDVMFDIAVEAKRRLADREKKDEEILEEYLLEPGRYILATIHRADNTDNADNLRNIVEALDELASSGLKVFLPVHPRTKKALEEFGLLSEVLETPVVVSEPVSYLEMVTLESNAALIITDSGGVQKEAYFCRVPCITTRDETEWTELVEIGWNKVVGTKKANIVSAAQAMLNSKFADRQWIDFYGGGRASEKIAEVLRNYAE